MAMKLVFSIPTGYHLRELVLPLRDLLTTAPDIEEVHCITPAAPWKSSLFQDFSPRFHFWENPKDVEGHKQLLKQIQPSLVITDTVGHDERDYPILTAAKELQYKTLTFIASWDNVWKIERLLKTPNRVALADRFIVWNQMMQSHMLRLFTHLTLSDVLVVGAPRLDFFFHASRIPSRADLFKVLELPDSTRPLIHLSTTELYPTQYIAKALAEGQKSGHIPTNAYLLATVHPGGDITKHQAMEKYGVKVRYAFGRHVNAPHPAFTFNPTMAEIYQSVALFKHTNVLINHSSTTALESLLANVPVINVKYGQPLDWWHWYRSMVYRDFGQHYEDVTRDGATTVVTSRAKLLTTTAQYLKEPTLHQTERQATIRRMVTTTDGTAANKVFAIIRQMAT